MGALGIMSDHLNMSCSEHDKRRFHESYRHSNAESKLPHFSTANLRIVHRSFYFCSFSGEEVNFCEVRWENSGRMQLISDHGKQTGGRTRAFKARGKLSGY